MKKSVYFLSLALILHGSAVLWTQEQKTDVKAAEILKKMIEAQGGREALASIKDMTLTGSMELVQMGLDGGISLYQKEPNKMRMDIEIMGMVISQAFDGETAWMMNPQTGGNEEMPEQMAADMRRQALGNDALLNPDKYNITYTYEGTAMVEDREHLVLKQNFPDGYTTTIYLDSQSFFPTKSTGTTVNQMGMEVEAETFQSDFRKVEGTGVVMPFSMTTYQEGEEFMTMTVDDVQFNTGIDDSKFQMN
jgi:outer membrane lipoprotein-sorting protein